ncbi:sugar ABC transporter permease [Sphaerobacter sp.]|uniref:sugar ABC transporter permease n=1 Tax=Sphaerobacter sp. TaxID=2099654 RepID=UPI001D6BF138|nr:sugar ABC transporter permease [Sphaerobacter sp.]MBX5446242.1 sugar ABC transporter permease [Sphaerobacter sp.]
MSTGTKPAAEEAHVPAAAPGLRGWLRGVGERATRSNIGALPVLLGLAVIAVIFQIANHNFLTALNLTNLMIQIAAVGTIAVGVTLVLLLGEIDLSVGAVSGLAAGVMAVLSVKQGWPALAAVAAAILVGTAIGFLQGAWSFKLGVPSFIVTLAGLLGWQGALLRVLGTTGTINLNDPFITGIANRLLPLWLGWAAGIAFVLVYAGTALWSRRQRLQAGLPVPAAGGVILRIAVVSLGVLAAVALMSVDRSPNPRVQIAGVPSGVLIFLIFVVVFDLITRRTRFGRHIYAVGGNAEAARRAGINVDRVRITVFMLGSTLAACGGILAASRLYAVNQASGSGDVLLNSIAAAVIGGTSLFGGRGTVWSALLGALVIGAISNGMDLLALSAAIKFMITGGVLLLAVTIDALARRSRQAAGRA